MPRGGCRGNYLVHRWRRQEEESRKRVERLIMIYIEVWEERRREAIEKNGKNLKNGSRKETDERERKR